MIDLDFILSHFVQPIWPRTIFTSTEKQVVVYSKDDALEKFTQAHFTDIYINAYSYYVHPEWYQVTRLSPNFLFIDLDLKKFQSKEALDRALKRTLRNIKEEIGSIPTILWTGKGYHIYIPVDAPILQECELLSWLGGDIVSGFLRFVEKHLCKWADSSHSPTYGSCLVRIPGSYNSNGEEVKIIQRWDGMRRPITPLIERYRDYLVDLKIKRKKRIDKYKMRTDINHIQTIPWIEEVLQTRGYDGVSPMTDGREHTVSLVIVPYLLKKGHSEDEVFVICRKWLGSHFTDKYIRDTIRYAKNRNYMWEGYEKFSIWLKTNMLAPKKNVVVHTTSTTSSKAIATTITSISRNDGQIYRSYAGSDIWRCRRCRIMGDKFDLLEHLCKRNID